MDRILVLTKWNFDNHVCSMVTMSLLFSEIRRTSPRQLLRIRRRGTQQTRPAQSVHAFVSIAFFLRAFSTFNVYSPTAQNLNKPLLSRPSSHFINLLMVFVPALEPSDILHRRPHRLPLSIRPPLYLPRRFHTQENADSDYEGIRKLG